MNVERTSKAVFTAAENVLDRATSRLAGAQERLAAPPLGPSVVPPESIHVTSFPRDPMAELALVATEFTLAGRLAHRGVKLLPVPEQQAARLRDRFDSVADIVTAAREVDTSTANELVSNAQELSTHLRNMLADWKLG